MPLIEQVLIEASPEAVWPYVADPVLASCWNEKIVGIDRAAEGPAAAGERYRLTYRMSRDVQAEALVEDCVPPERIVIRNRTRHDGRSGTVTVTWTLEPRGDRTLLTQSTDLRHSGLPRPIQWLAWALHRWGKPIDTPALEVLRDLVEEDRARRHAA